VFTMTKLMQAVRYQDISVGHRVFEQGGKCENLHGHNYRIHFHVEGPCGFVNHKGVVLDFSTIKDLLCAWLEHNWDHRFLVYTKDPWKKTLKELDPSVLIVPFNPTAENMAVYLLDYVCASILEGTGLAVTKLVVEETRKCSVVYERRKNEAK